MLDLDTPLPELLQRHPAARAVLDRYGLRCCEAAQGPEGSIRFFARAHGVPEEQLLRELQAAAAASRADEPSSAQAASVAAEASPWGDAIYRPYFLAGIAIVLTFGATWGAYLLWRIGQAGHFTGASLFEINAHGHAQIFGWVGLFIMGFALQAFPRMWRVTLRQPRLVHGTLGLMVTGIVLRSLGMTVPTAGWAIPAAMTGGAMEIAAIVLFVGLLADARRRSPVPREPYMAFIAAALAWFVIQAGFDLWHTWATMAAPDQAALIVQVSTYQAPLRDMQIHGLALMMILGVSMRALPAMFGVQRTGDRRAWAALALLTAGVIGEMAAFLAYRWTGQHAWAAGLLIAWAMLAAGAALVVWPWRLWRPMPRADRSAKFIRAAYGWLMVSLTMLLALPVYQAVSGLPFSHAYYGATRHAITVGFISLMIMGFAAMVVPAHRGIDARRLPSLLGPFVLVNLGCLMRVTLQIGTDWLPSSYAVVGVSGVLEVTGLAWWAGHLVRLMLMNPADTAANTTRTMTGVRFDVTVRELVCKYPQLQGALGSAGIDSAQEGHLTLAELADRLRWPREDLVIWIGQRVVRAEPACCASGGASGSCQQCSRQPARTDDGVRGEPSGQVSKG